MRAASFAVLCTLAAACALVPMQQAQHDPNAIIDAYDIAHGMSQSYASRPDADPAVTAELMRLDARAFAAIRDLQQDRGGSADESAAAVAALSDYAAQQTASAH